MKIPNDYMELSYRMEIVEDKDEGGFVVSYPDLPGCITCGETVESAVANALDAKKAWIEAALEEGVEIHEPDSLEDYSGQFNKCSKNSPTSLGGEMNCTSEHICSKNPYRTKETLVLNFLM